MPFKYQMYAKTTKQQVKGPLKFTYENYSH